jgi:hypothetical protein
MESGQNAVSVIGCLKNKRYSREYGVVGVEMRESFW